MYHLLVSYGEDSWASSPASMSKSRFLEFTVNEISARYSTLDTQRLKELTEYPALFMCEGEASPTFLARITRVRIRGADLVIDFERIEGLLDFPSGTIPENAMALDIHDFEFHRTHWAIKDEDIIGILQGQGVLDQGQVLSVNTAIGNIINAEQLPQPAGSDFNDQQIFIVHGHDDLAKNDVRKYVEDIEKDPIILHMQASAGMTIIEKIDHYSNVGFAIVLYTECDVGAKRDSLVYERRARQNVVFEHGYLIGKIGRSRVVALVKGNVETPNDISGVVYIKMTGDGSWQDEINTELRNCGYL